MSDRWLLDLYDRSHGVTDVVWADLGSAPEDRRRRWSATFEALGWARGDPRGSSRLLELAVGQAIQDGDLGMVLEEVHHLLGEVTGPYEAGLSWQIHLLWAAIPRAHRPETWDLFRRVVSSTPAQRLCVQRFLGEVYP